jgi:hypothetical protein
MELTGTGDLARGGRHGTSLAGHTRVSGLRLVCGRPAADIAGAEGGRWLIANPS